MELVVVTSVLELILDPPADVEVVIGRDGDVAGVE